MIERIPVPPSDADIQVVVASARADVLRQIAASRSSSRRKRGRLFGVIAVGAIALGGVTTATATGLFGGVESTGTKTSDFSLGPAPAEATYVEVTVDAVCQPAAKYEIDLDHAKNPASVTCGKKDNGRKTQLDYEFELIEPGPDHTVTVTTNVERKYRVRAQYRSGLTDNQRLNLRMDAQEKQREQNARVKRTDEVPSDDPYHFPAKWPDPYFVNENGMTIGIFDQWTTPYDQWPDLTPARTPDGRPAFTYTNKRGHVEDPEGAVEYMDWLVETGQLQPFKGNGKWRKSYTVYLAEDGVTVLDKVESGSTMSE